MEFCNICGNFFNGKSSFKKHLLIHDEEKIKCEECDKLFRNKVSLQDHQRNVHSEFNFDCEICKKCFSTRNNLNIHKRYHEEILQQEGSICHEEVSNKLLIK